MIKKINNLLYRLCAIPREKITHWFTNKIPDRKELYSVYSMIVFLIYTWAILSSFYKMPSWIMYLQAFDIVSLYAYIFVFSWFESLLVLLGVLFFDFVIFFFMQKQGFNVRTVLILIITYSVSIVRLILYFEIDQIQPFLLMEKDWWLVACLSIPLVAYVSQFSSAQSFFKKITEATEVFLYIYLPITIFGLFILIARNVR